MSCFNNVQRGGKWEILQDCQPPDSQHTHIPTRTITSDTCNSEINCRSQLLSMITTVVWRSLHPAQQRTLQGSPLSNASRRRCCSLVGVLSAQETSGVLPTWPTGSPPFSKSHTCNLIKIHISGVEKAHRSLSYGFMRLQTQISRSQKDTRCQGGKQKDLRECKGRRLKSVLVILKDSWVSLFKLLICGDINFTCWASISFDQRRIPSRCYLYLSHDINRIFRIQTIKQEVR